MSVKGYLDKRASDAVLSIDENASINRSISTLQGRLNSWFKDDLSEHFRFGSSMRGTILPRAMDYRSDIDYMVVWKSGGHNPQTYLDRLRRFIEYYYSRSDIKQSSPTIILELDHIKFDLVPAVHSWGTTYQIPLTPTTWQYTDPADFNATLDAKNKQELYKIKPTIRLVKFWNSNKNVYDSFALEKWIVGLYFGADINQKDYLFRVFDNMSEYGVSSQRSKDAITRAKQIITNVRDYEQREMPLTAESEIKKLIPE
ncbi:SMODS domain-containing nucleotidyltransferase [Methylorubrum populi]|uniref:SMODS domain-containing nucleotidyltransferase n=1 Tax=Methylorubrum populi TaxID=223967 RepID=UPI003F654AE4